MFTHCAVGSGFTSLRKVSPSIPIIHNFYVKMNVVLLNTLGFLLI